MSGEAPAFAALQGLTAAQREAALASGSALVVAGPGSGKTRTLVARLVYLLEAGLAAPHELCAITFTRKAASELRERLQRAVGDVAQTIRVGTFHQLALHLRPQPQAVRLISEADRHDLLAHVLRSDSSVGSGLSEATLRRRLRRASQALSLMKGRSCDALTALGQPSASLPTEDDAAWLHPALAAYQAWLQALDLEDLDDLLVAATQAVRAGQACVHYRCVHVDEYQDTNGVQRELLIALAKAGAQIFAIGDPDQSIYAFRGAERGNFFAFPRDFAGARVFFLRDNFRATSTLVAAATALLSQAGDREAFVDGPPPQAQRERGEPVQLRAAASPRSEAIAIAREIERLLGGTSLTSHDQGRAASSASGCYGFSDIAVLTRTAARADDVALALQHEGIPTLRPRKARPLYTAESIARGPDERAADDRSERPPERAATQSPFSAALQHHAQRPAWRADAGLVDLDAAQSAERSYAALRHALTCDAEGEIGIAHESDEWDARFERVAVLTLHGAKGLEFPVVFLCGSEADLLPGRAASKDEVAEERRLFYVGMTRAKDRLWISHVGPPSPFVAALPSRCVQTVAPPARRAKPPQLKLF